MQTLIRTSKLIDGTGTAPKLGWSLLVRDGVIVDLGPNAQFEGIEAEVIDLTEGVVTPGFLDIHTHFATSPKLVFSRTLRSRTRLP